MGQVRKTQHFRITPTPQGYLNYLSIAVHCNNETIVNGITPQRQTGARVFILMVMGAVSVCDS